MPRLKPPCTKDCPDRSRTCHGECERYQAFEKEKFAEYERREMEYRSKVTYSEDHERNARRCQILKSRRPGMGAYGKDR